MLRRAFLFCLSAMFLLAAGAVASLAEERSIIVASTTSTQDSGLFGHILPLFMKRPAST